MVRTVPQRTGAFLRIDPIGQIEFVEPILARNIISNLLPGRKCRCQQRQIGERRRSVIDGERSEIGLKNILLFPIEIDGELGGRRNTTVTGRSRLRNKFVVVARYISQESNIPTGIYLIGKIGLIIEKSGLYSPSVSRVLSRVELVLNRNPCNWEKRLVLCPTEALAPKKLPDTAPSNASGFYR